MNELVTAANLKTAAVVTILVLLASNVTSGASPIIRGGVVFGSALSGLYLSTKI